MKKLNPFVIVIFVLGIIRNIVQIFNVVLEYNIIVHYSMVGNTTALPMAILNVILAIVNATSFIVMIDKKAWGYYLLVVNCIVGFIVSHIISPHDWAHNLASSIGLIVIVSLLLYIKKDGYSGYQVIGVHKSRYVRE